MEGILRKVRAALVLMLFAALAQGAGAQSLGVRALEEEPGGALLEITFAWNGSLRAAVDSAGVESLSIASAATLGGGALESYHPLSLPSAALPSVTVVAADFDELTLSAGRDSAAAVLQGEPARVDGLGIERKRPVASLVVRHLGYDAESQTLRRYRRLVVRLQYAAGASVAGLNRLSVEMNPHLAVTSSALADGTVFKIPVREEGIYRLDRAWLQRVLGQAGIDLASVRPEQIRVFGNGGIEVPAINSDPRPADLVEIPVDVRLAGTEIAEILFYGQGVARWIADPATGTWQHRLHPYSRENFYFLKVAAAGATPRRIEASAFPNYGAPQTLSTVTGRAYREYDDYMWSKDGSGGLNWVGQPFTSARSMDVFRDTPLPGLTAGPVTYRARVAVRSNPAATVVFSSGTTPLTQFVVPAFSSYEFAPVAQVGDRTFSQTHTGGPLNLNVEVRGGLDAQAVVDWVRVFYPQSLDAQSGMLRFVTPLGQTGTFSLPLGGFSQEPTVWDVSDHAGVRRLAVQPSGDRYVVQVEVTDARRPVEIIAFTESVARVPDTGARVAAQNLHGIQSYPDYVIVAPDTFRAAADDLASYRSSRDGLRIEVVDVEEIYNEFSGGLVDPRALRDYFRFLYDRAPDEATRLRYVLLFGDGHYNYRGLQARPQLNNWIPTFQTEETLNPELSYTSDDYFGLLDPGEGIWSYPGSANASFEKVDLGIGRMTVQTVEEARVAVAKIKHYEDPATYGLWRTRYLFVADDGPSGLGAQENDFDLHTRDADEVATIVRNVAPAINQLKVYGLSYDRAYRGIWKIPLAHRDILSAIEEGVLAFNYSGHGGPTALAQEELFTMSDALSLDNYDKLALFVTATCSFGRWDMVDEQSAAEALLLNPRGGAIALLTTVRTVATGWGITNLNIGLNRQLNRDLFARDEQGLPPRLGDALRATKNTLVGREGNNRKFNLLGDPTVRIGFPSGGVNIASINGQPVADSTIEVRAMERVVLEGHVTSPAGSIDGAFNGKVNLSVYDAERRVTVDEHRHMANPYYSVREDLIWRGEATVRDGLFRTEFIVPKDISYTYRPGRVAAYARAEDRQAFGFDERFIVGGSAASAPDDARGPLVDLYLNDTTFVSGGLTDAQPRLIVHLFDESGINAVGAGVGHEMLLTLDGDQSRAINLSSRYESADDSFQKGRVEFPLTDYLRQIGQEKLSPGLHTAEVRAWDVLNNSTTTRIDFFVADGEDLVLRNVFNYPNPMVSATEFIFEHNQPSGSTADIMVRIYTLSGRPVTTIERPGETLTAGIVRIPWDGRDDDADRLATGIYLYHVRVKVSSSDGESQVSEHIEKLAVIR